MSCQIKIITEENEEIFYWVACFRDDLYDIYTNSIILGVIYRY